MRRQPAHGLSGPRNIDVMENGIKVKTSRQRFIFALLAFGFLMPAFSNSAEPSNWPQAAGPNRLIKEGAHPVTKPADILAVLAPKRATQQMPESLQASMTQNERVVIDALHHGANSIDELVAATKLPVHHLLAELTTLEIQGWITKDSIGNWHAEL